MIFGRIGGEVAPAARPPGADADAGPPPPTGLTWFIDETEGQGALAIRVKLGASPPAPGERVAIRGAWALDAQRRWFWQADAVTALPASDAPAAGVDAQIAPGLALVKRAPSGRRTGPATVVEGEILEFTVAKLPVRTGDGWAVSDRKWGEVLGLLMLPGDRESYGGHDLRGPDERWALKRNSTYWVRVGKVKRRQGEPAVITAAGPPFAFP